MPDACEAGAAGKIRLISSSIPGRVGAYRPLRNFTRVTEIASRLAALIPSEAGADPFKSFDGRH